MPENNIKRVLLVNPPESGRGEYSTPPLGLMYLASVLKRDHINVDLVDGYIDGWEGVEKRLATYDPSIIGITCHTYSRVKALKVAEMAKKGNPDILVVVGGAHATLMYRQILEHYPFVDVVVRGEGESTFLEICRSKDLGAIDGIAYRNASDVVVNSERRLIPNLDEIPFPAWEMIDINRYPPDGFGVYNGIDISKEPCVPVIFSRGCIGTCIFCSDRLIWKRWRRRSPKNMADELGLLNKKFNAKRFTFNDDLFTADKKVVLELCEEIIRRRLAIVFEIVTRTDCLDMELLQSLKKAGCFKICFGIETASEKLLRRMTKVIDVKISERTIEMTKSMGIKAHALLIVGNIGETRDTINETIDFLNKTRPDEVGLANGLRILPGTGLYEHTKNIGFIDDGFWLTDYNWKIYTAENSKVRLNVFCDAINKRRRLSQSGLVNFLRHRKFYFKAVEDLVKEMFQKTGLLERKVKHGKYKIAYR